ncbi:MAG: hypothetical protein LUG95_01285 [Clostridiales bacterium]|nr:hypothetical protein [Clostridiales bacterium]
MKKLFSVIFSLIIAITGVFSVPLYAYASSYVDELIAKGFPQSYVEKLTALHEKHPNWIFEPLLTGLDWQTAVDGERSTHSNQLIQKKLVI